MIIGLTGYLGSGKDTVISALKKAGYRDVTMSSVIREEMDRLGLSHEDRRKMQDFANATREKEGPAVWARKCLQKIRREGSGRWVIDGIRNPAEVEELRKADKFVLIAVTVPWEEIIRRILARKRDIDSMDPEEIRRRLRRESGEGEPPEGQQVKKCIDMADYSFENTMPLEKVEGEFMKLYDQIQRERE